MNAIIDAAFARTRTVALVFFVLTIAGASAYFAIPKESEWCTTVLHRKTVNACW